MIRETLIRLANFNPPQPYLAARSHSNAEPAIRDIETLGPNANTTFLGLVLNLLGEFLAEGLLKEVVVGDGKGCCFQSI